MLPIIAPLAYYFRNVNTVGRVVQIVRSAGALPLPVAVPVPVSVVFTSPYAVPVTVHAQPFNPLLADPRFPPPQIIQPSPTSAPNAIPVAFPTAPHAPQPSFFQRTLNFARAAGPGVVRFGLVNVAFYEAQVATQLTGNLISEAFRLEAANRRARMIQRSITPPIGTSTPYEIRQHQERVLRENAALLARGRAREALLIRQNRAGAEELAEMIGSDASLVHRIAFVRANPGTTYGYPARWISAGTTFPSMPSTNQTGAPTRLTPIVPTPGRNQPTNGSDPLRGAAYGDPANRPPR